MPRSRSGHRYRSSGGAAGWAACGGRGGRLYIAYRTSTRARRAPARRARGPFLIASTRARPQVAGITPPRHGGARQQRALYCAWLWRLNTRVVYYVHDGETGRRSAHGISSSALLVRRCGCRSTRIRWAAPSGGAGTVSTNALAQLEHVLCREHGQRHEHRWRWLVSTGMAAAG